MWHICDIYGVLFYFQCNGCDVNKFLSVVRLLMHLHVTGHLCIVRKYLIQEGFSISDQFNMGTMCTIV